MSQEHAGDRERVEAELQRAHEFASPSHGFACVQNPELAGNYENVVALLLVAEPVESSDVLSMLTQVLRAELALAVVVELAVAGLLDEVEHLLQGLAVGRGDGLPSHDGKRPFGVCWKR